MTVGNCNQLDFWSTLTREDALRLSYKNCMTISAVLKLRHVDYEKLDKFSSFHQSVILDVIRNPGMTQKEIAERHGITNYTVSDVMTRWYAKR